MNRCPTENCVSTSTNWSISTRTSGCPELHGPRTKAHGQIITSLSVMIRPATTGLSMFRRRTKWYFSMTTKLARSRLSTRPLKRLQITLSDQQLNGTRSKKTAATIAVADRITNNKTGNTSVLRSQMFSEKQLSVVSPKRVYIDFQTSEIDATERQWSCYVVLIERSGSTSAVISVFPQSFHL